MEKKDKVKYMRRYLIFTFLFFHNYIYIYSNGRIGKFLQGRPCLILFVDNCNLLNNFISNLKITGNS